MPYSKLMYNVYKMPPQLRYTEFKISKKSGGHRLISKPKPVIMMLQKRLNALFHSIFSPRLSVHGFAKGRSIVTNAQTHTGKRFVLNVDLENFFPSINFGRVRGMLMAAPFDANERVATLLAHICCHDRILPQGAPTSPIIANMICAKLDSNLYGLARKYHCQYTRYADDISFSTKRRQFPRELASFDPEGTLRLGGEMRSIITANGFLINEKKVRLTDRHTIKIIV